MMRAEAPGGDLGLLSGLDAMEKFGVAVGVMCKVYSANM